MSHQTTPPNHSHWILLDPDQVDLLADKLAKLGASTEEERRQLFTNLIYESNLIPRDQSRYTLLSHFPDQDDKVHALLIPESLDMTAITSIEEYLASDATLALSTSEERESLRDYFYGKMYDIMSEVIRDGTKHVCRKRKDT